MLGSACHHCPAMPLISNPGIYGSRLSWDDRLVGTSAPVGYCHRMADFAETADAGNPRNARLFAGRLGLRAGALSCALLMLAGASHCFIKGWLLNAAPTLGFALAWGSVTLLPWLVAWEANKFILRRVADWKRRAQAVTSVMLLCLVCTAIAEWLLFAHSNPTWPAILGLHALQHLPEMGIVGLLTVIAAYAAVTRPVPDAVTGEALSFSNRIIWARAAGNYVEFKIGHSVKVERMTLRKVEKALDPSRFARISRFVVINRSHIVGSTRGPWIRMSDNSEHRIGDAFRENLH